MNKLIFTLYILVSRKQDVLIEGFKVLSLNVLSASLTVHDNITVVMEEIKNSEIIK